MNQQKIKSDQTQYQSEILWIKWKQFLQAFKSLSFLENILKNNN